jgi:hypothetical protein
MFKRHKQTPVTFQFNLHPMKTNKSIRHTKNIQFTTKKNQSRFLPCHLRFPLQDKMKRLHESKCLKIERYCVLENDCIFESIQLQPQINKALSIMTLRYTTSLCLPKKREREGKREEEEDEIFSSKIKKLSATRATT